jgi:hypothetical protein
VRVFVGFWRNSCQMKHEFGDIPTFVAKPSDFPSQGFDLGPAAL